jgi:para-nitrobenzyl esterase
MRWRQFSKTVAVTTWIGLVASACDVDDNYHDASTDDQTSSSGGGPTGGSSAHSHTRDPDGGISTGSGDDKKNTDDSSAPHVMVDQGMLAGVHGDDDIYRFLGVPYAKPPVGERRFRVSEPPDTWDGVRTAKDFGHRCAQSKSILYQSAASSDEDCLTVNIWTPSVDPDDKLPVMVWIHGGGHINGSSAEPVTYAKDGELYDGSHLAAKNVVVVTINYRLGPLGFLSHPALLQGGGRSGDQGLWDQQMALRWVKKNITGFGGDGRNITIFGAASGAVDVCLHMVSPKSRGLFQQAIGQSGGCTSSQPTAADVADATASYIEKLGCTGDDPMACLRGKSVSELLSAVPTSDSPFVPIVDGNFIPEQPRYAFDASDVADVPYLLGTNTDEGALYASQYAALSTEDDYHAVLQRFFPQASLERLCELYPASRFSDSVSPYQTALEHVFGDAWWICPTLDTARRASKAQLDVYLYNSDLPAHLDSLGAPQGAEISYVFGTGRSFDSDQKEASDLLQSYWTNLALRADPNAGKLFEWPRLTTGKDVRVNFALGSDPTVLKDFHNTECSFWRDVYDDSFPDEASSSDDSDWDAGVPDAKAKCSACSSAN